MSPADHDADDLVVRAALGEPLSEDEQQWLDDDPTLQARVEEFVEIVDLARSAPEAVASNEEIDHLWAGIAAEAFGDEAKQAALPRADAPPPADAPPMSSDARVVSLQPRRARWMAMGAVAAAAVAVVALVAVGPWRDAPPTPIAAAELDPVGDADVAPVEGEFVRADQGAELHLDLSGLPPRDGAFYEVWLLDLDHGRLLSLGPVRPDGTYTLPVGTDVGEYPTVDVSVEPDDGDPGHSGTSVLRGPVQA